MLCTVLLVLSYISKSVKLIPVNREQNSINNKIKAVINPKIKTRNAVKQLSKPIGCPVKSGQICGVPSYFSRE